ncbi:TonB-dependent receptor [Chitinophaga rhizophila]|uniref:TonB-dependent receptor n=1 Tax=Chitinophaga rhizophila TaxID=2866212 RepID=A0ABS7GGL9_9BACT|nr:TonB-dependent receptor [Chitinophaga rhizophila]MBW8685633.1 TonB-dependent receptor [Chitinophaga rhizophila]
MSISKQLPLFCLLSFAVPVLAQEKSGDTIHLRDVEVTGKTLVKTGTASTMSLRNEQLEQTRGTSLANALSRLPGVSILKTGQSIEKPVINGMHSNRVLILNNGVRQEGQQWGAEHAPEVDAYVAKELVVIKGAEGVRYGADALGGVILVRPAPLPDTGRLKGEVHVTGASNGRSGSIAGMLNGNFRGIGWRVQGSYRKAGNIRTADYYLGNTGLNELNFSGALKYKTLDVYYSHFSTELGILHSAHIGTIEDINARIAHGRPFEEYDFTYDITPPRQQVVHDLGKVTWKTNRLEIQYAIQRNHRQEFDLRRAAGNDVKPMMDLVMTTQTLDAAYTVRHRNGLKSTWGVNGMMQVNNNTPGTGTTPLIPNYDSYTLGAYAVERLVKERFELEAGIRYDFKYFDAAGYRYDYTRFNDNGGFDMYLFTDTRQFHNVSGSLGGVLHINNKLELRSNLGLAWRAPGANELYSDGLHHGAAIYEIGNPDMKSEQGFKWVNSLAYTDEKLQLHLDIYGHYIRNYIYAQPTPDTVRRTVRGTFPIFMYQQTDAAFAGIDFGGSYRFLPQFTYTANAAFIRSREYLPYIPADRIDHGIQWDYKQYFVRFEHRYVARQQRYKANTDYAPPPPAYHLLSATAAVKYRSVSASLTVDNLANNLYKDYMNRFRYYAHEMGRNFTLRIHYTF